MTSICYEFIAVIIEVIKLYLIYFAILEFKPKLDVWRFLLGTGLLFISSVGTVNLLSDMNWNYIFGLIAQASVLLLCFGGSLYKKLIFYPIIILCLSALDIVLLGVFIIPMGITYEQVLDNMWGSLLGNSLSIGFLLVILVIKTIKRERKELQTMHLEKKHSILILFSFIVAATITYGNQWILKGDVTGPKGKMYILLLNIFCLLFIVICIGYTIILNTRRYYKDREMFHIAYIDMQEKYYQALWDRDRKLRYFRHDIKGHLISLKTLNKKESFHELSDYINQIVSAKEWLDDKIYTGNKIVDAVIHDTIRTNQSIDIKCEGVLPDQIKISSYDICCIFYNAITNAVEACVQLEAQMEKEIEIKINIHNETINITVSNPVVRPVEIKQGEIQTTKEDKISHGFGIYNMKQAVKKYNGEVIFRNANGNFIVDIMLQNIAV